MQNQTGTRSRQKREPRCKAPNLARLKRLETGHPLFWLPFVLNSSRQVQALEVLLDKAYKQKRQCTNTQMALIKAIDHLRSETADDYSNARRAGILPLCWQGTRALDAVEVAA